jgi:hypothetical protein
MLRALGSRLTYANVMATLAVFIALGGSSYAALKVTGKNVKNNSLTGADVKNSSLTTKDVKNRSLLSQDFKAGQLPSGPAGAQGPQGPPGPPGAAAASAFASVGTDGTLRFGRGATGAFKLGPDGSYSVTFNRSTAGCAMIGTQGFGSPAVAGDTNQTGYTVSTNALNQTAVHVTVTTPDGTDADASFFLALLC